MRLVQQRVLGCVIAAFGIGLTTLGQSAVSAASATEIDGTVFRDDNANGIKDAWESGESGITVTATNATGASASATSGADGKYTVNIAALGSGPVRLELSGLPTYLQPGPVGADNSTTVKISSGGSTVNFGVLNPASFCQKDPKLATACFQTGGHPTAYSTLSFSNKAQQLDGDASTAGIDGKFQTSTQAQVGNVVGGAYQRGTKTQYWAAYVKRHAPLGPAGVGGIYKILPGADGVSGTADDVPSTYVDLNSLFPGSFGSDPRPAGFSSWLTDPTFDQVSRNGFGDLDVSEDGRYLYAVSLADKRLYRIDTHNNPSATPVLADVSRFSIPMPDNCPSADVVPFGLGVHDGKVYVGSVCNAQTSNDRADLRAYVFQFDPASSTFSSTPVMNETLNFARGCTVTMNEPACDANVINTHWNPWRPTHNLADYVLEIDGEGRRLFARAEPLLSDIDFLGDSILLGFRDRTGDQASFWDPATQGFVVTGGDLLRACSTSSATWRLESNAASVAGCTPAFSNGTGAGNDEGPGGGEFFNREVSPPLFEIAQGNIVALPHNGTVASISLHPRLFGREGGVKWFTVTNGQAEIVSGQAHNFVAFQFDIDPARFAKANGMGDLEALCAEAPLEIGNVAWFDADHDGVQDPDEKPVPGVKVTLKDGDGNILATATTDANGQYLFLSQGAPNVPAAVPAWMGVVSGSGITTNTNYTISFDTSAVSITGITDIALSSWTLTGANAGANDAIDSDATGTAAMATISLTTGGPGANNHTYDVGYWATTDQSTTTTTTSSTSSTTAAPTSVLSSTTVRETTTTAKVLSNTTVAKKLGVTGSNSISLSLIGIGITMIGFAVIAIRRREV